MTYVPVCKEVKVSVYCLNINLESSKTKIKISGGKDTSLEPRHRVRDEVWTWSKVQKPRGREYLIVEPGGEGKVRLLNYVPVRG